MGSVVLFEIIMKKHSTSCSDSRSFAESGGVIVEFLLTIPIIFIFFTAVLELGRLYSQVTWVSNMAYEVAVAGAGWPQGPAGDADMIYRSGQLGGITSYHRLSGPPTMNATYNHPSSPPRTITVNMSANVPPLVQFMTGDFQTSVVAPMLANDGTILGSFNNFANPACLYDCNGAVISNGGVCCTDASTCPQAAC